MYVIHANSVQKEHFHKRTHNWHFHSCFLVFSYYVSIDEKQNFERIFPSHRFAFLNGVILAAFLSRTFF